MCSGYGWVSPSPPGRHIRNQGQPSRSILSAPHQIQEALGLMANTQVATSRETGHLVTEPMEHYCGRMSSVPNVVRLSM